MTLQSNEPAEVLRRQIAEGSAPVSPDVLTAYPNLAPTDSIIIDWKIEEHTAGSYSFAQQGVITGAARRVADPTARIHYAGEHLCPQFQGYMEGALQSGVDAAAEIMGTTVEIATAKK